ncbi:hypothetical protein KC367_g66 [Hortaea werneckii]|nr:hypothetical protein KC367_g66 [Hortaea werneckii]
MLSNDAVPAAGSYLQLQYEQLCRRPRQSLLYSQNLPNSKYYARPKGIAGPGGNSSGLVRSRCAIVRPR